MNQRALFLVLFCIFLLVPHESEATFEFMDGKLRVKGRFEQYMVFLTNLPKTDLFYRHRGGPPDWNTSLLKPSSLPLKDCTMW